MEKYFITYPIGININENKVDSWNVIVVYKRFIRKMFTYTLT